MMHCHPLHGTYACAACNGTFCMTCDAPIADSENLEIKTIGGRFCDDCLQPQAEANGLSAARIRTLREERKLRRLADYPGLSA